MEAHGHPDTSNGGPSSAWEQFSRSGMLVLATWMVWGFAGCASVPDKDVLNGAYVAQEVEFKNAWGPVSARTRDAIQAELTRTAGNGDILGRQIAIEQAVAGTPLAIGNKVTLLQDGPATYRAMFDAIRQAKSTINVEFYIIGDDEIGQQFADLLLERRAAGTEINVIYDSVGSFGTAKTYFERLQQAGIHVVEFNPIKTLARGKPWNINHRDHRKQVIVDGRVVFLGGINIDDVYATSSGSSGSGASSGGSGRSKGDERHRGWRDTDIAIEGPAVAEFQKLFLQTWEKQHGPPLSGNGYFPTIEPRGKELVRAIGTSPDDRISATYLTFLAALSHAETHAYITNAYFVPDPQLVTTLIEAVQRGVDVRLILPSTTDSRSAAFAAHSHYETLLKGGVKIYERRRALLHAKTAIVDGVWSRVGSSNLDWRSAVDNDELDAVIVSRDFAQRMLAAYALDEAQSDEITLERWQRRPMRDRFKEWIFRVFGRLL